MPSEFELAEEERGQRDSRLRAEVTVTSEGGDFSTGTVTQPIELASDWEAVLKGFGLDPDIFEVVDDTVKMSKWQQSKRLENGERDMVWLYSYRARFRRKVVLAAGLEVEELRRSIRAWKPHKAKSEGNSRGSTFVICWADWQLGKSAKGGVEATIKRIEESFTLSVARIAELRKQGRQIDQVAIINMGDPCEGCDGNYASQLFSVELTQREQLDLCLELWTKGVTTIRPDVFGSVLCNHGEWTRRGGDRPVTTDSDNIGGYLGDTLRRVFEGRKGAPTVWRVPHDEMVTTLELSGVKVAFTHGHKIPSPAKELDWLRGQSIRILRDEGAEPRLWVTAHRHHVRLDDFGAWWRFQCPSLDGGSKWLTDAAGVWSTPGTMTFLVGGEDVRGWSDFAVLGTAQAEL